MVIFTARKRSLWQGNDFTLLCHSVHRGRGCLPHCMLGYIPPSLDRHPPWQTPTRQTHPLGRHSQADTPLGKHPLGRRPLGKHPLGRHPWADSPLGRHPLGRHPLGKHSPQILRDMVNKQAVHILLECILVLDFLWEIYGI